MRGDVATGDALPPTDGDGRLMPATRFLRLREHLPPLRVAAARDMLAKDSLALRIAVVALSLDLAFIVLHIIRALSDAGAGPTFALLADERWSMLADWGYAEMHNYVKLALTSCCLIVAFRSTRAPIYLAWSIVFVIVLMDDALLVHETLGPVVATIAGFGSFAGLPAHHFGELAVWGAMGLIALTALYLGFRGSAPPHTQWGVVLLVIFAGLVFAGIVVDGFTVALKGQVRGLGVIEDGGELIMVSLALIVSVLNSRRMATARTLANG